MTNAYDVHVEQPDGTTEDFNGYPLDEVLAYVQYYMLVGVSAITVTSRPVTFEERIEQSSLGTPEAKAIRDLTPPEVVEQIERGLREEDDDD